MKRVLKIGTRGSPLALAQTDLFIAALCAKHPDLACEKITIVTSGDAVQDKSLADIGGKGLFTREIEDALLKGAIDCAVHSMKDMPTQLPPGLFIACLLPREDPRDAFFSAQAATLDDLPPGSVVGTSSPRRQAIVLARRPDLKVVVLRGNVGTRLRKLEEGAIDATILAMAGVNRLGLAHLARAVLEPDVMLPAASQGAIGIEARRDDARVIALLSAAHCRVTELRLAAERGFLDGMGGSCRTPLAALMGVPDAQGRARFDVLALRPDGTDARAATYETIVKDAAAAEKLGRDAAREMLAQLPPGYLF